MMTREERAKQFQPFDAMKGLKEALLDREEKHSRVERHEIGDEEMEHNSAVILKIERGMRVRVDYYKNFHDVSKTGQVTKVDTIFKYIVVDDEKIHFDDLYLINRVS